MGNFIKLAAMASTWPTKTIPRLNGHDFHTNSLIILLPSHHLPIKQRRLDNPTVLEFMRGANGPLRLEPSNQKSILGREVVPDGAGAVDDFGGGEADGANAIGREDFG